MGNKKVVNSSVADRSSYNIHVIHDKKPATLDDLIGAENGKPVLVPSPSLSPLPPSTD